MSPVAQRVLKLMARHHMALFLRVRFYKGKPSGLSGYWGEAVAEGHVKRRSGAMEGTVRELFANGCLERVGGHGRRRAIVNGTSEESHRLSPAGLAMAETEEAEP